jgi:hypothetical protein
MTSYVRQPKTRNAGQIVLGAIIALAGCYTPLHDSADASGQSPANSEVQPQKPDLAGSNNTPDVPADSPSAHGGAGGISGGGGSGLGGAAGAGSGGNVGGAQGTGGGAGGAVAIPDAQGRDLSTDSPLGATGGTGAASGGSSGSGGVPGAGGIPGSGGIGSGGIQGSGGAATGGTGGMCSGTVCGSACCGAGQRCAAGNCVCDGTSCPSGCCSGTECVAYGSQSNLLCGNTGAACGPCSGSMVCENGQCKCPSTLTACSTGCIDKQNDNANCGGCGIACTAGQRCALGVCVCDTTSCTAGCCNGTACVGTAGQSTAVCGASGAACAACLNGTTCQSGHCLCPTGLSSCSGSCVDEQKDLANCGACGKACGSNEKCASGACACSGVLWPCLSLAYSVPGTESYGILRVSGFSDATREWVAYLDSSGNDTNNIVVVYDVLAMKQLRQFTLAHWFTQVAFVPGQSTLLYSNGGNLYRATESATSPETLSPTGVTWFAISPDATVLAIWGATAGTLRLYSYPGLALQSTIPVNITVSGNDLSMAFSPDSSMVAIAGGYANTQVQVFSVSAGTSRYIATATGATATYSPAFSADGTKMYVGGGYADGGVYVFDSSTGTQLKRLQASPNYEYTVAGVPGFSELLAGGYDGNLQIVDASSGAVDASFAQSGDINIAQFSPDGKYVYVGIGAGSGKLAVYRVN